MREIVECLEIKIIMKVPVLKDQYDPELFLSSDSYTSSWGCGQSMTVFRSTVANSRLSAALLSPEPIHLSC